MREPTRNARTGAGLIARSDAGRARVSVSSLSHRHWHGFRVVFHKRALGAVDALLFGSDRGEPAALAVRLGSTRDAIALFDVGDVEEVNDEARTIHLRALPVGAILVSAAGRPAS